MTFVEPNDSVNDPYSQLIDPSHAASQLAALLGVLREGTSPGVAETGDLTEAAPEQSGLTAETGTTETATTETGTSNPIPGGQYNVSGAYGENRGGHIHGGIDLGVPVGTTVVAAATGKVVTAADSGDAGNLIEIQGANGVKTRYMHLSSIGARVGESVRAGQPIGKSGGQKGAAGAGNSEGPHLHFEVRDPSGATVDPAPYLAGGAQIVHGDTAPSLDAPTFDPAEQAGASIANTAQFLAGKEPTHGAKPLAEPVTGSPSGADPSTQDGFFAGVLQGIGAPVTPANMQFLRAFARAEGGSADNPFNTSQQAPGSSTFNTHGVQRYGDPNVGLQATIKTLTNGMYAGIIAALKKGTDPYAAASALSASPWDADGKVGGLVMQILRGG